MEYTLIKICNITGVTMKLTFTQIWNDSLIMEQREPTPRDYCWASELGKPMIDRYLAMKGVAPSNAPNMRSYRKFFAGNVWEFVAGLVLYQIGIVQEEQRELWVEDAPLRVKGKLDYLIGGVPNYDKARDVLKSYPFQKDMTARFMRVVDHFEQTIGHAEILPCVHEIKSCSQYLVDKIQNNGRVLGHDLQIYHYLRALGMDEGHIDYISRDDALMAERRVFTDPGLTNIYDSLLSELKGYLDSDTQPEPDPLILFEDGRFIKNFGVEYSNYLTMIYGFERPDMYDEHVKRRIDKWNRVLVRARAERDGLTTDKGNTIKLTDANKEVIDEIHNEGFEFEKLL